MEFNRMIVKAKVVTVNMTGMIIRTEMYILYLIHSTHIIRVNRFTYVMDRDLISFYYSGMASQ